MNRHPKRQALPPARRIATKALHRLEKFLHIESVSGIFLMLAAATALIWANSSAADSYHHIWNLPLSFGIGEYVISNSLHFWINDALMTIFFLVVGMEVRREIHDGSLSNFKLAALPIAAALGGVIAPALIYLACNSAADLRHGWAVPTATDIAFALGVLTLLGKSIPTSVRVFLLALAIIDDIVAVLIIALFYAEGLDPSGLIIAGIGILFILGLQHIGIGSAYAYLLPGALIWLGLLKTGAHPTLAGVILGLMTPVRSVFNHESPMQIAARALKIFTERKQQNIDDQHQLLKPVRQLHYAQRELLPPVTRVQMALHPWVAYGIMPLFALANAGISLDTIDLSGYGAFSVMSGVAIALLLGKPIGILLSSFLMVKMGWCRLPEGMSWSWMALIGCLAGIGFTMAIFISNLAFSDAILLGAAKLGILIATLSAAIIGLIFGAVLVWRHKRNTNNTQAA